MHIERAETEWPVSATADIRYGEANDRTQSEAVRRRAIPSYQAEEDPTTSADETEGAKA